MFEGSFDRVFAPAMVSERLVTVSCQVPFAQSRLRLSNSSRQFIAGQNENRLDASRSEVALRVAAVDLCRIVCLNDRSHVRRQISERPVERLEQHTTFAPHAFMRGIVLDFELL